MKTNQICAVMVFLVLFGSSLCQVGHCEPLQKESFVVSNVGVPKLSADNDKIIFDYSNGNEFSIAIYEISRHKLYDLKKLNSAAKRKTTCFPSFSQNGKMITFIAGDDRERNIYVMNVDGSGLRQLTDNYLERVGENITIRYNIRPSFSPDGKRIIFIRSVITRPGGGDPFEIDLKDPFKVKTYSYSDIYEIDIQTGKERRLTNYEFGIGNTSAPYYMSDGKRFVFSGHGPQKVPAADSENAKDYKNRYQENTIFIMDGEHNVLKPAFVNGRLSRNPHVSLKDTIIFISVAEGMDGASTSGSDARVSGDARQNGLFIYQRGTIKCLTTMKSLITWSSLSPDGSRAVFLADLHNLWMMNTDGTGLKKINIPWEQLSEGTKRSGRN
jgi:Tol biopolymer transport system component